MDDILELRHHLHSIAELSGEEKDTARFVTDFISETNPDELITDIGGHGILASYNGTSQNVDILLRCELDALPIPEENDLDYKSQNEQTGHKCGHDGHMAIICGVAERLKKSGFDSNIHLLFQPAEETGEGARRVLDDDKFKIDPDYVFALHNLPGYPRKSIVVRDETFASASIGLITSFEGETSHAANPQEGRSPAMAMSQLIQSLSSIPQFDTALDDAVKVTVIHAVLGEQAFGTSPGKAKVMATLRAYSDGTLEKVKERAVALAQNLAQTYDLELSTDWIEPFPATVNHEKASALVKKVANRNNFKLIEKKSPFGWSEDFGHFTKEASGAMFGLGAGENHPSLHASTYDFPDNIIETGVTMFLGIIEEIEEKAK